MLVLLLGNKIFHKFTKSFNRNAGNAAYNQRNPALSIMVKYDESC